MAMRQRTFAQVDESISVQGLDDGRQVVKVTPGGAKIVAYVSDGKATRYEAEDPDRKSSDIVRHCSGQCRFEYDSRRTVRSLHFRRICRQRHLLYPDRMPSVPWAEENGSTLLRR